VSSPALPALIRLTLTDFRNYGGLRLDVGGSLVALIGQNGAGKTNLLEAVSLLAPGRGLRGAGFDQLGRLDGSGAWAIAAEVTTLDGDFRLGSGWTPSLEDAEATSNPGRMVLIDGKMQKGSGALGAYIRMLWLTPAMDRLFAGPPGDRRRFLDRLVASFDPEHGARITVFEKVMRERNLLLQEHGADRAWLASLESHMAEAGIAIAAARLSVVETLGSHLAPDRASPQFPWGKVAIEGEIEQLVAAMPAVHAEDEYRRLLHDSRGRDRAAGRSLHGPHRSDLSVVHGPKAMPAETCSTGEQKALLIGLILAQARAVKEAVGASPLMLLDEVAAHLDAERRDGLFANLAALGAQVWMTGTDAHLFSGLTAGAQRFHVDAGTLTEMSKT
jgi:DNA replication and repair protein RecF